MAHPLARPRCDRPHAALRSSPAHAPSPLRGSQPLVRPHRVSTWLPCAAGAQLRAMEACEATVGLRMARTPTSVGTPSTFTPRNALTATIGALDAPATGGNAVGNGDGSPHHTPRRAPPQMRPLTPRRLESESEAANWRTLAHVLYVGRAYEGPAGRPALPPPQTHSSGTSLAGARAFVAAKREQWLTTQRAAKLQGFIRRSQFARRCQNRVLAKKTAAATTIQCDARRFACPREPCARPCTSPARAPCTFNVAPHARLPEPRRAHRPDRCNPTCALRRYHFRNKLHLSTGASAFATLVQQRQREVRGRRRTHPAMYRRRTQRPTQRRGLAVALPWP